MKWDMDEVLALIRQAGAPTEVSNDPNSPPSWWAAGHHPVWIRFAELVAAKERERCARLVEQTAEWRSPGWTSTLCPITKKAVADAIRKHA